MNKYEKLDAIISRILIIACIALALCGIALCICAIIYTIKLSKHLDEVKAPEETEIIEEVIEQSIEEVEEPLTREALMFEEFNALSQIENKKEWFLAYKEFIEKYPEYDRPQSIYEKYDEDEIYLMQRVIETEVYGCDFEAKTHVASVILNRIEGDNKFPNDATAVCTAPGQFVYSRKQISEDTKLALEYAEEIEDTTNGALYFNSMAPMDSWNGRELIFTDEVGHSFY